jgi:hypothetical protein
MPDLHLSDENMNGMLDGLKAIEEPDPPVEEPPAEPAPAEPAEPVEPPATGEPPVAEPPVEPQAPVARTLSDQEWEAWDTYRQLDDRLRTDPEFAARFRSVFETPQPTQPQPSPPAPAPQPDPLAGSYLAEDPAYQQLQSQLRQLNEVLTRHDALLNQQREAENVAVKNQAEAAFKQRHGLDDTQFQRVYQAANNPQYLAALQNFSARGVPLNEAFDGIFETAYWSLPEMRELELARAGEQRKADQTRKAKAGSLSGSSGSVPRTAAPPQNEAERRQAMTDFLAQAIGGNVE